MVPSTRYLGHLSVNKAMFSESLCMLEDLGSVLSHAGMPLPLGCLRQQASIQGPELYLSCDEHCLTQEREHQPGERETSLRKGHLP